MSIFKPLNNDFIPLYKTPEGRKYRLNIVKCSSVKWWLCWLFTTLTVAYYLLNIGKVYDETLETVTQSFPQYIKELQGTADGAQVDFYKVSEATLRLNHRRICNNEQICSIFPALSPSYGWNSTQHGGQQQFNRCSNRLLVYLRKRAGKCKHIIQ